MDSPLLYALIVEDNPAELAGLADFVASEGFFASRASTLAEARRILEKVTPAVILCDYLLPDGRGTQLLAGLGGRLDLIDFVLVTSSVNEPEVRRREFLPKPVNLRSLQRVLARARKSAATNLDHTSAAAIIRARRP